MQRLAQLSVVVAKNFGTMAAITFRQLDALLERHFVPATVRVNLYFVRVEYDLLIPRWLDAAIERRQVARTARHVRQWLSDNG